MTDDVIVPNPHVLEWFREEKRALRRWMVCGMFPNWGDAGHETAYPPENSIDFNATYEGWYKPITWRRWYSLQQNKHRVNLQEAFTPVFEYYPRFDRGTGYAYTEFSCMERMHAILHLDIQDATKVWLNHKLELDERIHLPHKELKQYKKKVLLREGRNTLLVKVSKIPGEFQFGLDIISETGDRLDLLWWR